ncbi:phosphatase PAP2 family protein [Eubacteriales bacterium OttesenSCG-928-N13]|nr:phosphatase PAP2 family protein [Eubacteriales bacterium OttesenSCG-928-N13]
MDIEILLWFAQLRNAFCDNLFLILTQFGDQTILVVLVCLMYWCLDKRVAQHMMFSFFLGGMINQLLKITFCIPRPWIRDARLIPVEGAVHAATGYSFPSGHTASATAVYGSLAMNTKSFGVRMGSIALVLLVGVSRMYLGVHTPQDVITSWVIGVMLLFVLRKLMALLDRHPTWDRAALIIGLAFGVALILYAQFKSYPIGADGMIKDSYTTAGLSIGLFIGWFWERRSIQFDTNAKPVMQIVKLLVGVAIVAGIKAIPSEGIIDWRIVTTLKHAVIALFVVAIWPMLFAKVQSMKKEIA